MASRQPTGEAKSSESRSEWWLIKAERQLEKIVPVWFIP